MQGQDQGSGSKSEKRAQFELLCLTAVTRPEEAQKGKAPSTVFSF